MNAHPCGDPVADSIVPCPVERDGFPDPVVLDSMDLSGDTVEASCHPHVNQVVESAATRHSSDAADTNTSRSFAQAGTPTLSVAGPFAKNVVLHTGNILESYVDFDTGKSWFLR